jgi:hypothetical protein
MIDYIFVLHYWSKSHLYPHDRTMIVLTELPQPNKFFCKRKVSYLNFQFL